MLNSVLLVGVPMAVLLAAAFYVYTRAKSHNNQHGPGGDIPNPWNAENVHRRPTSTQTRRRRPGNHNSRVSRSESQNPEYVYEEQCEICFEDVRKVQLYPCKHSDICETCATRLLLSTRECPFCRAEISGYVDFENGDLFG